MIIILYLLFISIFFFSLFAYKIGKRHGKDQILQENIVRMEFREQDDIQYHRQIEYHLPLLIDE